MEKDKPNFMRQSKQNLSTKIFGKMLLDKGVLSNFLTTQYEEVLSYLKEMRKYFLEMTIKKKMKTETFKTNLDANSKINIELNKGKSTNNIEITKDIIPEEAQLEEIFINKIDYIIEAIQSQNLYEYNNLETGGDFLREEESSEDVDSFIGFLSNY